MKSGRCWSPQTPPSGKYLNPAIVPANAYQCTKFQLPSSISFWDLDGSRNKVGAADLPRRPLADKFLHVAIVPSNAYYSVFQKTGTIFIKYNCVNFSSIFTVFGTYYKEIIRNLLMIPLYHYNNVTWRHLENANETYFLTKPRCYSTLVSSWSQ